ncbi:hypothetical protein P7B02_02385 [Caulobacter segnis]|uniref:hypothetical protein n=1 Tax=Caulobacter segnis TaxID=88688 RepID=UPI00240EEF5D|nr:hypothetical protein [Caulobacter segnis]MDG2520375.1 hypothetical protein [Caulobacter segnis]
MRIDFTPVTVATDSADREGFLMLADDQLVGVIVRLAGSEHGQLQGAFYLEAGFGRCAVTPSATFESLDVAGAWARARLH